MTDPNYWLAAWFAVMAGFLCIPSYVAAVRVSIKICLFYATFVIVNAFAALYCAGFVMVMP